MTKYFNHGRTVAVIVDTIADISAPTLAEIAAGTDVTEDLWGLTVVPSTTTTKRTRWRSRVEAEAPVRYGTGITLGGYRHTAPADEILWPLATFGSSTHLVVRRGILTATAFAAGQVVEVYKARWGRRGSTGADGAGTFEVPLYPYEVDDAATVAA